MPVTCCVAVDCAGDGDVDGKNESISKCLMLVFCKEKNVMIDNQHSTQQLGMKRCVMEHSLNRMGT